jgi:uncharacterized protein YndB with AHSA1/START domain
MNTLSLTVSQVIKSERTKVFRAWIDPDVIKKWFAPGSMTVPEATADARVGGKYRIVMKGEDGSPTAVGEYKEVVANERLVFTWRWEGDEEEPTLVTVTFKDVAGGTEVAIKHEKFTSKESRDRHADGWRECLANLSAAATAL